ncbi:MAG TPA: Ig-like domain-containing protein [Gemmatimonadaceae bacterium]|nr:Ig-like domain-containing protein [Gemmatimonadaceae bacterium]
MIPAILTTVSVGVVLTACSEATPPPTPKSVAFSTHVASMVADDALPLPATVTMSDGSAGDQSLITYSSSVQTVATVDSKGLVTARSAGTTTISAQVGSLHDEVAITVSWAPITAITFGRDTATLLLDDSLSTSVVVTNSHNKPAPNAVVTYSSANTGVATVDANGRVRTFATGATTITATVGNLHSDINVTVAPHFTQIATGGQHTCGITGTRRLYCWGSDINGNLGVGTSSPDCSMQIGGHCSLVPIPVTGAERFVSVTAGEFHTCALTADGAAYCWGGNYYGQVGTGTTGGDVRTPTAVTGGHKFTSISAGRMHTCGIDTSGDTWCWGWDSWGQLGAGVTAADRCSFFGSNQPCSGTPLKVAGNVRFAEVMGSEKISCGRDVNGAAYCWGAEVGGTEQTDCQAGENANCTRTPLLQVSGAIFQKLGMGGVYRCGQKSDGVLWCWGYEYYGMWGNGNASTASPDSLVRAAGGKPYAEFAFGNAHMCGRNAGAVECWGNNYDGQGGGPIGVDRYTPGPISGGIAFASITSGPNSSTNCGISTAGRAYCWGNGRLGNLGNGTLTSTPDPVLVKLVR